MSDKTTGKSNTVLAAGEMEQLIAGSFLRNVPMLLESGLSMDEAVKSAYEADLVMLVELQIIAERRSAGGYRAFSDKDKAYQGLIEKMSLTVWERANRVQ